MNILYLFLSVLFIKFSEILSVTEFNKDEMSKCIQLVPTSKSDCLTTYTNFTSLICCYFNMSSPMNGGVCVPMGFASNGLSKTGVNISLYSNINVLGDYSCRGGYNSFPVIFLIFFIFIMII